MSGVKLTETSHIMNTLSEFTLICSKLHFLSSVTIKLQSANYKAKKLESGANIYKIVIYHQNISSFKDEFITIVLNEYFRYTLDFKTN